MKSSLFLSGRPWGVSFNMLTPRLFAFALTMALWTWPAAATQEDWPASGGRQFLEPTVPTAEARAAQMESLVAPAALPSVEPLALGPVAPAPGQPNGALTGRIIFAGARHGWVYDPSAWRLCRPVYAGINEDNGNLDQMTLFAYYCFNAGATVAPLRPVGHQTNEVVLDNTSPAVTYSGTWHTNSTNAVYYGVPGTDRFRFALLAATETATATYTPTIPMAGFYPVYTWVAHGGDRTSQLYRIRHTGGEATVRVPHHMVGNGWVYLGTYYFAAGTHSASGAVAISNLEPAPTVGNLVIADAIRFGNGMGTIARGGLISTYPREEEASRYWVQNSLGQGQSSDIYDIVGSNDETDDFGTTARMSREMNREQSGNMYQRVYIGFHSNATTGNTNTATARGTLALYNYDSSIRTPNQVRLATLFGQEVTWDMTNMNAHLEVPWHNRGASITYSGTNYAEINNNNFGGEMDATIIEVAFHDNTNDVKLLLDPKARNWVARASYHAVMKYMNEFDGLSLNFLPEPPCNARAFATNNGIRVAWNTPVAQAGSGGVTGYRVYRSTDGYGFGDPVTVSGGLTTSVLLTNLATDTDYYFRVAAVNAGGESFPSEVVGCRRAANPAQSRVLFVNAFDRFDRTTNLRQSLAARNYVPPGNSGTTGRVMPRANNSFDYVVQHGQAISAFGLPFDSCQRQAVTNGSVSLGNYEIVVWSAGQSLTNTFRALERNVITNFLNAGGHLFVSGADIAWDLDRASGPTAADRGFLNHALRAELGADVNDDSGSYTVTPVSGSIFAGAGNGTFDDGTHGIYWVQNPDVLTPVGTGTTPALHYVGGVGGAAAVQYDGSAGGGRVVYLGFPFETLTNATTRADYMARALRFFSKMPKFEQIVLLPDHRPGLTLSGEPGLTYTIRVSDDLTNWVTWTNIVNVTGTVEFADAPATNATPRFYRALLSP